MALKEINVLTYKVSDVSRWWSKKKIWGIAVMFSSPARHEDMDNASGEFLGYMRSDDPTGSGCRFTYKKRHALRFDNPTKAEAHIKQFE
jgi:hypothetical protein